MQKRFISTSTHILDPANPSTPPIRPSPPPEKSPSIPDPNDKRTLFDRLSESKAKKQEAFEEAYKFSNLIKRLDDSESDFLTHLQSEQSKEEREKKRIEGEQIDAFRNRNCAESRAQSAIEATRPSAQDIIPPPPLPPAVKRRGSSNAVKQILVKRKSESQGGDNKRRRSSVAESPRVEESPSVPSQSPTSIEAVAPRRTSTAALEVLSNTPPKIGTMTGCLTGFEHYSDSDDDSE